MRPIVALAVGLLSAVALAACGGGGRGNPPRPRPATRAAVNGFVNRAQEVDQQRFTAGYRISVVGRYGHVFRGRISVSNWSANERLFRETPAFSPPGVPGHAYEVLVRPGGVVNCSQPRRGSRWRCDSEIGEGMGGEELQNGAVVPAAFSLGLSNAVAETAPHGLFLGSRTVDGRSVRCLSLGNRQGAGGRVCTTSRGLVVSYRLPARLAGNVYASAQLVSYSTKVDRRVLTPPAKPACPSCAISGPR